MDPATGRVSTSQDGSPGSRRPAVWRGRAGGAVVSGAAGMPDGVREASGHPAQSMAAAVEDFGDAQLGFDVASHNHAPPCDEVDDEPPFDEHAPMTAMAVRAAGREAILRFRSMSGCLLRWLLVSARTGRRPGTGPNQAAIHGHNKHLLTNMANAVHRLAHFFLVNGTVPPNSALQPSHSSATPSSWPRGISWPGMRPAAATAWPQRSGAAAPGSEAVLFEQVWRSGRAIANEALLTAGKLRPDKKIAKAARVALVKANSVRNSAGSG